MDQRKRPTDVKVHVKTGAGVDITWADGHASHFDFAFLRDNCPCATCNDERGKKEAMKLPASAALPMYKLRSVCPCSECAKAFRETSASSGL